MGHCSAMLLAGQQKATDGLPLQLGLPLAIVSAFHMGNDIPGISVNIYLHYNLHIAG